MVEPNSPADFAYGCCQTQNLAGAPYVGIVQGRVREYVVDHRCAVDDGIHSALQQEPVLVAQAHFVARYISDKDRHLKANGTLDSGECKIVRGRQRRVCASLGRVPAGVKIQGAFVGR